MGYKKFTLLLAKLAVHNFSQSTFQRSIFPRITEQNAECLTALLVSIHCGFVITVAYSLFYFKSLSLVPVGNYIAFSANIALLVFWILGVNQSGLESTAKQYAKALLSTIDLL